MVIEEEIIDQIYCLSEELRHKLLELEMLIENIDKDQEE